MTNLFEAGQAAYENELLERYCVPVPGAGDLWWFGDGDVARSRVATLGLIRAYLGLGLQPSPTFTAEAFAALYDRLNALEKDLQHFRLKG